MTSDDHFLDGNAAAGALREVFSLDVTTATGQCVGCGSSAAMAETRVYVDAPGLVMRCRSCDSVLLRVVRSPDRTWIDMRGLTYLELAMPAPGPA